MEEILSSLCSLETMLAIVERGKELEPRISLQLYIKRVLGIDLTPILIPCGRTQDFTFLEN